MLDIQGTESMSQLMMAVTRCQGNLEQAVIQSVTSLFLAECLFCIQRKSEVSTFTFTNLPVCVCASVTDVPTNVWLPVGVHGCLICIQLPESSSTSQLVTFLLSGFRPRPYSGVCPPEHLLICARSADSYINLARLSLKLM